jgi:DNA-directed RNA polymerase subunit omega
MIELLKNDDLISKVGGRFKLTSLIQKRWLELMRGARPLVDNIAGKTELEVIMEEILQDKIGIDYAASGLARPESRERGHEQD